MFDVLNKISVERGNFLSRLDLEELVKISPAVCPVDDVFASWLYLAEQCFLQKKLGTHIANDANNKSDGRRQNIARQEMPHNMQNIEGDFGGMGQSDVANHNISAGDYAGGYFNAMLLSTCNIANNVDGVDGGIDDVGGCFPSSRVVLLKAFSSEMGFCFFTNYESSKAKDIASNPYVALNFFWQELGLQVRVGGITEKTSREFSQSYFKTRSVFSRIGAIVSKQSNELANYEEFKAQIQTLAKQYQQENIEAQCPKNWGGYVVKPLSIEFWQEGEHRFHKRLKYQRSNLQNPWQYKFLYP